MIMKTILSLSVSLCVAGIAAGNPNWKIHNTFDEEVTRLVDTGDYVYFISRTQPFSKEEIQNSKNLFSLFRYDKEADELLTLSTDNLLTANVISGIEYSPEKRMLVVVYANHDIDLLYDNGQKANIPAYRLADVDSGKDVNSIFIDAQADRIYLSTGFGYVALNDKKQEVAESRIYGTSVKGMSRLGDQLLLLTDNALLAAPVASPRFNLSDYSKVRDFSSPSAIGKLSDDGTLVTDKSGNPDAVYMISRDETGLDERKVLSGTFINMEPNSRGILLADANTLYQFYPDGHYDAILRPEDDRKMAAGSHNLTEIWYGEKRKGIRSKKYDSSDGERWTLTRDFMLPNAPSPFKATNMVWHPDYGLLISNHGYDWNFLNHSIKSPILLSGYSDGVWSNLSPVYTYPEGVASLMNPNGLAVDPDNPDYVYFGSLLNGIERINLNDGSDILHLSRTSDLFRDQPGYVRIVPDQKGEPSPVPGVDRSWKAQCMFSAPEFDADGNMWLAHCDFDDQYPLKIHIFCWEAADRRKSTDAAHYSGMKTLKYEGPTTSNFQFVKPLVTAGNRNLLLWTQSGYYGDLMVIDTNGTAGDNSDDKTVRVTSFHDQDGQEFDVHYITTFFEDSATGNVWVGHSEGVFYFKPSDILSGNPVFNRIKVARNDGTNLADYLLNQVKVNRIAVDGKGRKWFATSGAGAICTSADGRIIEEELTTGNSLIPDNIVYGLGYVPTTNSMVFSTDAGIAEYFMTGGGTGHSKMQARAYPNPVRPDYFGYVTIDGLPEDTFIKIVDSRGNLVKELGRLSGGEISWDITDTSFKRVGSGVYFILSSTDENSGNQANVGKILIVN